jgi:hypothetical protein
MSQAQQLKISLRQARLKKSGKDGLDRTKSLRSVGELKVWAQKTVRSCYAEIIFRENYPVKLTDNHSWALPD